MSEPDQKVESCAYDMCPLLPKRIVSLKVVVNILDFLFGLYDYTDFDSKSYQVCIVFLASQRV